MGESYYVVAVGFVCVSGLDPQMLVVDMHLCKSCTDPSVVDLSSIQWKEYFQEIVG